MAKIQNISEIHPTLGFTEFDVLEKYRKSFNESELGRLHSAFPFDRMAKAEAEAGTAGKSEAAANPQAADTSAATGSAATGSAATHCIAESSNRRDRSRFMAASE